MKQLKLTASISLFFLFAQANGQNFLNETSSWEIKDLRYDDLFYFNASYTDYLELDTLIGNHTYFKLNRQGTIISGFSPTDTMFTNEILEYKGAIREEDKIIYWIEKETEEPVVIYDFNIQAGDFIELPGSTTEYELLLVDSIFHDQSFKKVYELNGLPIQLIEGVGWNTGFINSPYEVLNLFYFSYLQCYNKDDQNLNPDLSSLENWTNTTLEHSTSCENQPTNTIGLLKDSDLINVFPNPFENKINIATDLKINEIILLNSLGEKVFENKGIDLKELVTSNLQKGIYFVVLKTDDQDYTKKVIRF